MKTSAPPPTTCKIERPQFVPKKRWRIAAMATSSDGDDDIRGDQRDMDAGNEEWQGVQRAAEEGHHARDAAAQDRIAASGQRAIIREALGEGHADARASRCGQADEERWKWLVRQEGDGEDGRQRRDGAIHQPRQPRLHHPQHEAPLIRRV